MPKSDLLKPLSEALQHNAVATHTNLTATRWMAETSKQAVREYFAPGRWLVKLIKRSDRNNAALASTKLEAQAYARAYETLSKTVITLEEAPPTSVGLIDDVASQHAGNWTKTVQEAKRGVTEATDVFKR